MKKVFGTALLLLPLLALPAQAHLRFIMQLNNNPPVQLGPWYVYWPQDAYFTVPAPCSFPYWPAPQTLPGAVPPSAAVPPPGTTPPATPPGILPPPANTPPGGAAPGAPPDVPGPLPPPALGLRPANFHAPAYPNYQPQAPSYWYDR